MRVRDLGKFAIGATLVVALAVPPAFADNDRDGDRDGRGHGQHDDRRGRDDRRGPPDRHYYAPPPGWYDHGGYRVRHWDVPPGRRRVYHDVIIVRPFGHWYSGYGHYHRDDDALFFLGFTAITLMALNSLSEAQQRAHEDAQIRATSAPIGQPIIWSDGSTSGAVTALREGHTPDGGYCREFQQTVTIGGKQEQAYGTACRQPDGAWKVVE